VAEIKPVTPEEAAELLKAGHVYVDVRSEPEFEAGHPEGALNVPLLNAGPVGLVPNPEFLAVMESAFGKDEALVIGCKAGGRSKRAAEMLAQAGFSRISDQIAGFDAGKDAFGRAIPGWSRTALPVGKDEALVIGCKAGGRSKRAAELLAQAGFSRISDQIAGFDAGKDAFGRAIPGWSRTALPVGKGKPAGQAYDDVKQRKPR
jgi:rhodanese-related sulfurtransferase